MEIRLTLVLTRYYDAGIKETYIDGLISAVVSGLLR